MVRGLSRPGNSVRAIIFFDVGIYSTVGGSQKFLEPSGFGEWKGTTDIGIFWCVLCLNNAHGLKYSGAQVDLPHKAEFVR